MSRGTLRASLRPFLRPAGRPIRRGLDAVFRARLNWVYLREDIDGIEAELRRMRSGHADVLRQFGARVDSDATIVGPICIVNARRDFANLEIGPRTHIGSEVFLDLADRVRVEAGATVSMRAVIVTHLDVGRGPLIERRPRATGPVVIEEGAFVGAGAIILKGVTIGREAMVGAGTVIDGDVAPGAVVADPRAQHGGASLR